MKRVTVSIGPPTAYGTTIVIVRVGYSCWAEADPSNHADVRVAAITILKSVIGYPLFFRAFTDDLDLRDGRQVRLDCLADEHFSCLRVDRTAFAVARVAQAEPHAN